MQFQFGGFELDSDSLTLVRQGELLKAEPRVLELLIFLVENRHRLVSKEELNERLWQGRAVSDAALTRSLYQARKLLGDSSSEQKYLVTVHGRGVRFSKAVDVREVGPESATSLVEGGAVGVSAHGQNSVGGAPKGISAGAPVRSTRRGGVTEEVATALPVGDSPGVPRSEPPLQGHSGTALGTVGPFSSWSRRTGVAALVMLGFAVSWWVVNGSSQGEGGKPGLPAESFDTARGAATAGASVGEVSSQAGAAPRPRLAILPLTVPSKSSDETMDELNLLGLSLVDLLHSRLATVPGLELRSLTLAEKTAASASSIQEMAEDMSVSHVLAGSMEEGEADRAQVSLELYERIPGKGVRSTPLGVFAIPKVSSGESFGSFVQARDAIAERAARLIGSAFQFSEKEPGASADGEAWRFYILGYQRLSDDFCSGSGPAKELFQRALEIDPSFGLAWQALGMSYYNRVWACGESAELYGDALAALDRALELAPELRVPRFTRITLLLETGKVEEAYEAVAEEAARTPDDKLVLNAQSYALRFAGFLEPSSKALDRLLELDPLVFAVGGLGGSPNTYLYQGRLDRFLDVLPASEMPYHRWYRGFASYLQNQPDAARATLEPAFRAGPSQIFGRLSHALLAVLNSDGEAAEQIVKEVSRQRLAMGSVDAEISYKQSQLLSLSGDLDAAFAELSRTVHQGFFCVRCFESDPTLEPLRRDSRWSALVEVAKGRHLAFARRFDLVPETI
ncbi:MAG: winged helix-turn-helix domain-containing protein [Deltaproteobacteria bacterium]|nr:winged helix-turn-helix domain-containing protein [Deltaproteobacteria bacterium]